MPLTFAQISDTHLDGSRALRDRLTRVARELAGFPVKVDAILVTGDIVQCAGFGDATGRKLAEYRFAHETLAPLAPVAWCPGNSDDEAFDMFQREIGITVADGISRLDVNNVTFLLADTRVAGQLRGHLEASTLSWLGRELSRTSGPVVVAMHHPPVRTGHPVIDEVGLDNADALRELVLRFSQVIAMTCGHTHLATSANFAGRLLFVAPGVHSGGQLPWAYAEEGEVALIDPTAPPGYALHRIEEGTIASFPVVLGESLGP